MEESMTTVDELLMHAPLERCFEVAADVERWPSILPHYRNVRFLERAGDDRGIVKMSAWRDFAGPLRWPTWWVSDMRIDRDEPAVHYRHVDGITRGMIVKWSFESGDPGMRPAAHPHPSDAPESSGGPSPAATHVRITHEWTGPEWPLIGGFAWRHVIAPQFVHVIASRTLAGVAAAAEHADAHAHG
jgi:ribosome-associated toxin RatA of RatAB toxin-antitoxin module